MGKYGEVTKGKSSSVWDMSQERMYMEGLVNQRFNFFMVVFSITVTGAISAKNQIQQIVVLVIGTVVTFLMFLVILRAHLKLNTIFKELKKNENHPATIINSFHSKRFSVRLLIGFVIPSLCCAILLAGAFAAKYGVLLPDSDSTKVCVDSFVKIATNQASVIKDLERRILSLEQHLK